MNNLGYSKDNVFIGDVRVKGQDETVIIGNENGGPGYILPEQKGSEGQVITMNADNTTSFQDAAGGGDNVLGVGNGADITIPYAPSSSPVANIIPPSFIGTRRVNIKDIAVGGSIHFYVNSRYNLEIPSAGSTDTFTNILFFVTGFRADNTSVGVAAPTIRNNNYFSGAISVPADLVGYLKVEGVITRTATDTFKTTVTAFNRRYADSLNPCQIWENVAGIEEINFPAPQDDDYIQWQLQFFNSYYTTGTFVLTNPSAYWTLKNVSDAITPPVSTSDHTQLTNLALGDAGHTQFALLQGRTGGQVLSGGITPAHFLTLKSHTAGLDNMIIRDLNTEFKKNLQIGTNQILDTLNNSIDFIGGDMNLLNTSLTNRIVVASQNNIDILANNQIQLSVPNLSNNIIITSTDTSLNQALNMNNNNINNVLNINSASNINLNPTGVVDINGDVDMGGNRIIGVPEIVGDGTNMTIRNGGGISVLFDQATSKVILPNNNLDMNNNVIENVNNVISSGTLNLESSGGGSQSIQLDGTFITFFNNTITPSITPAGIDVNNGVISSVSSINGITPVGGLYAGTSAGALINTTALTTMRPSSAVGTLTVPANGFSVGDCFHLVVSGDCSLFNNDTIQITLRQNGSNLAQSTVFAVENANAGNNVFEIEADFTIRSTGASGSVHTSGEFTYNKDGTDSKDFRGIRFNDTQTIDTTVTSTLDVIFQFVSRPGGSTIQTQLFRLQKVY